MLRNRSWRMSHRLQFCRAILCHYVTGHFSTPYRAVRLTFWPVFLSDSVSGQAKQSGGAERRARLSFGLKQKAGATLSPESFLTAWSCPAPSTCRFYKSLPSNHLNLHWFSHSNDDDSRLLELTTSACLPFFHARAAGPNLWLFLSYSKIHFLSLFWIASCRKFWRIRRPRASANQRGAVFNVYEIPIAT